MRSIFFILLILSFLVGPVLGADVSLRWDAVTGATGYKIYKSEDGGSSWSVGVDVGNVVSYNWAGVNETKLILFRVSAFNVSGETINYWSGAWFNSLWKPVSRPVGLSVP